MKVALCRGHSTGNRCHSWRNDNRGIRMTIGDCIVYRFTIIRSIRCHRRNVGLNLIEQVRYFRHVADVIRCQFRSDDFMRASIHAEVTLASPPV